jgi:hypothetical protein
VVNSRKEGKFVSRYIKECRLGGGVLRGGFSLSVGHSRQAGTAGTGVESSHKGVEGHSTRWVQESLGISEGR